MDTTVQNDHQSAGELLEVWDWEKAVPLGKSVSRREAHRLGIPHEGVHLWIITKEKGLPEVLFQMRAPHKDHYPDCLDITVGGHVPFGLGNDKIQKEAEEEIGIDPDQKSLVDLGWYRYEERDERIFHREFQRVYLLLDSRPLNAYRFNDSEVTGLYAVPLADLEALFTADREIQVRYYDGASISSRAIAKKDFHPQLFHQSMYPYMTVVLRACRDLAVTGTTTAAMPPLTQGN